MPEKRQQRGATFRGHPPTTKHDAYGLPVIVVCPTDVDLRWNFGDVPVDENEYMIMLQGGRDTRTPEQRLRDSAMHRDEQRYDSQEIGVQCFDGAGWPERTGLSCWWCLHTFESRPFPCPISRAPDGVLRILGVFCGPSCAKAWAISDGCLGNSVDRVLFMIDWLAQRRGFCCDGKSFVFVPPAPPRTALQMFRGPSGLTIAQFRGLCAAGFDVSILSPPYITQKQVIVADCTRMSMAAKAGRVTHVDSPEAYMMSAAEYAERRRAGLEMFAGVGVRRLSEYLAPAAQSQGQGHRGKVKAPLPPAPPMALNPKKRKRKDKKM